jgi:hypothetical protein
MDQRATTEAELYERLFPGRPLPYWLGEALRAPVRDIPTVEDWQREQGHIGVPSEEQSSREVGQNALDYLTMAHGLANLLKSGGAGAQELMGKQRGVETFGKEMMDTSRRARSGKWLEMETEKPLYERPGRFGGPYRAEDLGVENLKSMPDDVPIQRGRTTYSEGLPVPSPTPQGLKRGEGPADAVRQQRVPYRQGELEREAEGFRIGTPVELPGGRQAQYAVIPSGGGNQHHIVLHDGERMYFVDEAVSLGAALAQARQLQNRLTLAAKDAGPALENRELRSLRLPWEKGSSGWQGWTRYGIDPPPPPQGGRYHQGPGLE